MPDTTSPRSAPPAPLQRPSGANPPPNRYFGVDQAGIVRAASHRMANVLRYSDGTWTIYGPMTPEDFNRLSKGTGND